jgi:serine protease Do
MVFPYLPKQNENKERFLIQDPFGLRRSIIPLFTVDRETELVSGLGTAFRIDPFGTYLTAHHVFECSKTKNVFDSRQLGTVFGLFSPGLVLGSPALPKDVFIFVDEVLTFRGVETSPLIHVDPKSVNSFDCAQFFFDPSKTKVREHKECLPIQLSDHDLHIGEAVMAVGYPGVMSVKHEPGQKIINFTEGLYGAIGTVTNVYPHGRGKARPWPTFEVSCPWPGGMSGGPIFNQAGHVIGLVSTSFEMGCDIGSTSYSFWFHPASGIRKWLRSIDADNVGNILGWGVLKANPWHLAGVHPTPECAKAQQSNLDDEYEVKWGSHKVGTDDFIYFS